MYLVVAYDCRDEETRRKVRSLLRKYSFTMLTYSMYVGRGSRGLAERLSASLSKLLGEGDRATVILLNDFQYELLVEITKGAVSLRRDKRQVIVFYGRRPIREEANRGTNESPRRPEDMQTKGFAKTATSYPNPANAHAENR
jgi:CRISPR-associated endonuclease Cas2